MSETQSPRRVLQSIGAVLAGLVAIVVLSIGTDILMYATGVFPPQGQSMADALWLLPTAYRIAYGVAGCYLAARLAPGRPMRHAMVLGAIGVAAGIAGVAVAWNKGPEFGPMWYAIAVVLMQLPCAWVGGRLHGVCAARNAALQRVKEAEW